MSVGGCGVGCLYNWRVRGAQGAEIVPGIDIIRTGIRRVKLGVGMGVTQGRGEGGVVTFPEMSSNPYAHQTDVTRVSSGYQVSAVIADTIRTHMNLTCDWPC